MRPYVADARMTLSGIDSSRHEQVAH